MLKEKLSPNECVLLLRVAGFTLKEVSDRSGVGYTLIGRVARGQAFVDYKVADKLRATVEANKQAIEETLEELKGVCA